MGMEKIRNEYAAWLLEAYDMDLVLELAYEKIRENLDEMPDDDLISEMKQFHFDFEEDESLVTNL